MKVLFLTNIPSPYRVDFFNEFGKYCDLTVVFEGVSATDRNSNWKAVSAEFFKPIYLKGLRTGTDNFLCPSIIKLLRKKWDRIIVGMYSTPTAMLAIEYMHLRKISFILSSDGGFVKDDNKIKYLIKRHFISSASAWLSTGDATTKYLVYYGADMNKCFIYPFTSLLERDMIKSQEICKVDRKKIKEKLKIEEDFIVLSVGRFSYDAGYGKGYDAILNAAESMNKSIGFYIVGDEPTEEFLQWKLEKGLNNVHFVGFKTKSELNYYYAVSDIFILMTREDVWGLVINEAMSFGLPIITTYKCIAGLELIKGNGYLVDVGDYSSAKANIEELKGNKDLLQTYRNKSKEIVKNYTIEKMALRHIEILNEFESTEK